MNQAQHEKACKEKFGESWSEVHVFLDQYFDLTRSMTHRVILHHQKGINLVVQEFGEAARGPAEQHIMLDFGFVPEGPEQMDKYYCPASQEEADLIDAELKNLYDPQILSEDLKFHFNRVILVRSTDKEIIDQLYSCAKYPSEVLQVGEYYGFGAYFEVPRPTRENCREGREFMKQVDELGAEYLHCSALAMWMDLEKFLKEGFAFRDTP